jgi:transposase
MKFRSYDQQQQMMLPPALEDFIPSHHFVRVLDAVVEQLDLSRLYASYSEEGQPAYHPKMLLKVLLYGYATGVRSSRKMAQKLESDVFFMYLAGMQRPDFRTLSDFRKSKRSFLQEYFTQVLLLCRELGMASLGHVAIDGSKVKASAAKNHIKDRDDLLQLEEQITEQVDAILNTAQQTDEEEDREHGLEKRGDELPEDLLQKERFLEKLRHAKEKLQEQKLKRVNLTDPDARLMHTGAGSINLCYNTQLAVDSDQQVIVACDVTSHEHDKAQFIPLYEQTVTNTQRQPREVSADAGYHSGKLYLYLEQRGIDAYVPDTNFPHHFDGEGKECIPPFDRRQFQYEEGDNTYRCPADQVLTFLRSHARNGVKFRIYEGTTCPRCRFKEQCISKPTARYRQIQIYENDVFKAQMRAKLLSREGKQRYRKRLGTVEPVFAQLKHHLGFRQFLLRGLEKVRTEFRLLCTAYNIKKLAGFLAPQLS